MQYIVALSYLFLWTLKLKYPFYGKYFNFIYRFVLKIKSFPNVFHAKDAENKNTIVFISVPAFGTESIKAAGECRDYFVAQYKIHRKSGCGLRTAFFLKVY